MPDAADERRANIPLGLAILLGYVALLLFLPWTLGTGRAPAAPGDPKTLYGVVFFAYSSGVLGAAALYPNKCFLFTLLTKRPGVGIIAGAFLVMAAYLLLVWLGGLT